MDASSDEQRKVRIISHMNGQHARELSHYLRHYAGLSSSAASPPTSCVLRDVTLDGIIVRAPSGKEYSIPFEPPRVPSWADVKDRLIAMDVTARAALGISDVLIDEYVLPRGPQWITTCAVLFYAGCAATFPLIQAGSTVWHTIDDLFPGGMAWYRFAVWTLSPAVAAVHISEAIAFDQLRMKKHGVPRWSALWWKWEIDTLIEGIGAWKKMARTVEAKRKEKKGGKSQ